MCGFAGVQMKKNVPTMIPVRRHAEFISLLSGKDFFWIKSKG